MLKDAIKKNYKWIIVFLCVVIFLLLLEDIFENEILDLDVAAYRMIVLNLRTDSLTGIMKVITSLGGAYVLIALTLGALLVLKNRKISIMNDEQRLSTLSGRTWDRSAWPTAN